MIITTTTRMNKYCIPRELIPYQCSNLIRLGRNYDGGYILNLEDIYNCEGLISLGISYDWSFERDFSAHRNVPIFAYDGSVNLKKIWKHNLKNLLRVDRKDKLFEAWYSLFKLYCFFDGKKRVFNELFVGSNRQLGFIGFEQVIEKSEFKKFFLKMDIEGSEYALLEILSDFAPRTSGLCLEFHNVPENLDKIIDFIQNYPLSLVHTHINNCAPPAENGLPQLLELSFSGNQSKEELVNVLPNDLDMPNSPKLKLPIIEFKDQYFQEDSRVD